MSDGERATTTDAIVPRVCMYLFLDASGATVPPHPSPRTASPLRYLECALVQAASLQLAGARCEIVLATNLSGPAGLGRAGRRMWEALSELGVERLQVALSVAPGADPGSTRMLREAIVAATAGEGDGGRAVWVPNLDCVWVDPARALAVSPSPGRVGALTIDYPPAWRIGGPAEIGSTRVEIGRTAAALGAPEDGPPPWVGADLLVGTRASLGGLVSVCDELDGRFAREGAIATNEQLLTLAASAGGVELDDLSMLARRIHTGARHTAGAPPDAAELAMWHLPAEKGLSIRRAARALLHGGSERLRDDLADPVRALRRFNVGRARGVHQLRDDWWVARGRLAFGRRRRAAVTLDATGPWVEGRKD